MNQVLLRAPMKFSTRTLCLAAVWAALAVAAQAMQPAPERPGDVVFTGGKEGYACYRTPALVISSKGTVLAFCGGRVNDHRDEGDIDIVLKRSTDGGRTWGPLQVLANDGPNPCKGPIPIVLPSGRILLLYLWNKFIPSKDDRTTREVYVMSSDDDGLTWSEPRNITSSVYRKGWRWYGLGPCHAIVKQREPHKGRIVVPARHNTDDGPTYPHVIYSDDDGGTWHIGGIVDRAKATESTIVELSDGSLMINCRNQKNNENHRLVAVSRDGGESFGPARLEKAHPEPRGCQGSLAFHSLNEETGRGNIIFSNPANEEIRSDGTLQLSTDDGETWTSRYRYAPAAAPYFTGYSDIAVFADGSIGVLYERGEYAEGESKGERYNEMAFVRVPFERLSSPQRPTENQAVAGTESSEKITE
jgi:sialidase-1